MKMKYFVGDYSNLYFGGSDENENNIIKLSKNPKNWYVCILAYKLPQKF